MTTSSSGAGENNSWLHISSISCSALYTLFLTSLVLGLAGSLCCMSVSVFACVSVTIFSTSYRVGNQVFLGVGLWEFSFYRAGLQMGCKRIRINIWHTNRENEYKKPSQNRWIAGEEQAKTSSLERIPSSKTVTKRANLTTLITRIQGRIRTHSRLSEVTTSDNLWI